MTEKERIRTEVRRQITAFPSSEALVEAAGRSSSAALSIEK